LIKIDDKLEDLLNYSKNITIDINYSSGKKFNSKYDWFKYQQSGVLELNNKEFVILDTQILIGGRWFDIDWNQMQGLDRQKQYFYRACFDFRSSKIAKNIKEI
jgi:hypothetical protein